MVWMAALLPKESRISFVIKLMVIANDESTIFNFRREILRAFVAEGFQVIVCYPLADHAEEIRKIGCELVNLEVSRHGTNVAQDLKLLHTCQSLIRVHRPNVVLTYTVKPNVYGSLACQMTGTRYINNVTGLGSVLQRQSALSKLILWLQKCAFRKSSCVFFQNTENCSRLKQMKVIGSDTRIRVLPGSGVNLQAQAYEPFPQNDGMIRFIMVSRIRADKGYGEFFDAAEQIKKNYPNTEFHVVGWYEEDGLRTRLDDLVARGVVIYHGQKLQEEVHRLIGQCNCLVHPSYHEGMANVLLEAAATGRPVVASDIPGCRETFEEGVTGFGCKAGSVDSLVEALARLIAVPYEEQIEMGKAARLKMEREFDRQLVAEAYITEIKRALSN